MTPTMAAIINQFSPVTPPPENQTFAQKPVPLQPPLNPPLHPSLPRMGWGLDLPLPPLASLGVLDSTTQQQRQRLSQPQSQKREGEPKSPKREPSTMQPPPLPKTSTPASAASQQRQCPAGTQPQPEPQGEPQTQPRIQALESPPSHMDPKDLALAARIASFYQQRCHTIATYQQQRCQAWASAYRKKCQDTTQAAMLVVAWYVRDRIKRRRRRQKDRFRRGLREMRAKPRPVAKRQAVREWVTQVPRDVFPPDSVSMNKVTDKEEEGFSMDAEAPRDKDSKLLEMADGLIRSQYRNIEVPLMGVLSFDESDSESDASAELCGRCKGKSSEMDVVGDLYEQEHDEGGEDDDYEDYEEELYDDEDMEEDDAEIGSELVHGGGTGQHSQDTEQALPLL